MNKTIRVLIVDDEEPFAVNLARLLRLRGYDASTAFDGFQAVEEIKTGKGFDVVILDVKMPGMDGVTALGEIKKNAPDTEVIMLTGHATVTSGTQAIRRGAFDYLMKPCDIEDIVQKINEAYEVERIKRQPVLWPRNLVKDITRYSFKKLETEDLLEKALEIFNWYTGKMVVEEIYVHDREGRLRGTVTKRDLLHAAEQENPKLALSWNDLTSNPNLLPQESIKTIMRHEPPQTTTPEERLTDVAHRMIVGKVRCMPVTQEGKVIGIIRLQDILQHIQHETE